MNITTTETYDKWFQKIRDIQAKARINIRIRRLALDNPGDNRSVGGDVRELRIDYGPGYRLYFVNIGNNTAVLLNGGTKKNQDKDVKKAIGLAQDIVGDQEHEQ